MALHAVRIELRAEQISYVFMAESGAAIPNQARRSDACEFRHDRHQLAGTLEFADHRIPFRIDAAFDVMQQRVALAVTRVLEIGHGADRLAEGREDHLDRVIEAAAREPLQACAIRTHTPDA